jgi:hypothetical protein
MSDCKGIVSPFEPIRMYPPGVVNQRWMTRKHRQSQEPAAGGDGEGRRQCKQRPIATIASLFGGPPTESVGIEVELIGSGLRVWQIPCR